MCGNSSLTHAPHWPCWANLNIGATHGNDFWPEVMPVIRWPMRIDAGQLLAVSTPASFGL